ncbi:MAG: YggS family pyridoxal phosphate enzyme [Sphingobacteriia bacterium 39-39-8]|nr:MAG: YggS family pyridoxal phosphate enzyme [Sphingobacteriia bacterium 39-39-8]HQR92333.1 YggS family pyridoxal phosphate-dependent enzyme [Sediminibacterium sp.]
MPVAIEKYQEIKSFLDNKQVALVAVSKTKPQEDIQELYALGQRDFGENYVQELVEKEAVLPKDIHWHFIGHLQSNKVKYIAPFVHLIHGVDSFKLLVEINKQAAKNNRVISVLLQMHIAKEETKFGMDAEELKAALEGANSLSNIKIIGLMGMASFSDDLRVVQPEFAYLNGLYQDCIKLKSSNIDCSVLSMGMSGDYQLAIENGSNMVRIGSLLFGARNYNK